MKAKAKNKNSQKEITTNNFIRKIILVALCIGLLTGVLSQISFDAILPIKKIRAQGEFINVTEKMILDAISDDVNGGYLRVNVHGLKLKIEELAWVKEAAVRRVWPDSVVVTIKEQTAYAFWKNNGLLNEQGEYFEPVNITALKLPVLMGPENIKEKVMTVYQELEDQLNKVELSVSEFKLDDRRAIYLQLSNDIKISLGRNEYRKRLMRFITAYKIDLKKYSNKIDYVDMRYTNGFSIKWKENTQATNAGNMLMGVQYV
ncbi:MAG: cell division protein FtsQ/DivIB [Gammaproteobacteria bacterium]